MKIVDIVTVEKLTPIYKNGEEANSIQVCRIKDCDGNSCQFNIIVGKGLYNLGDKAIYIQPDYCLPPTDLFKEYHAPSGDPKKSKLGKKGRIRAIKFNFQFKGESDPIYSNGILLPYDIVASFIGDEMTPELNFQEKLQIIKYVSDDSLEGGNKSGLTAGDLPSFLYPTDENRIELLQDHVNLVFTENEILSFTRKRDGSSSTIFFKMENDESGKEVERIGICSRAQEKKLDQRMVSAYKDGDYILHRYINKDGETPIRGWYNDFTKKFYTNSEVIENNFIEVITEIKDSWVDTCKKNGYLDKLIEYSKKYKVQLALRGELVGCGNKGSGNKQNLDAKGDSKIVWFGVDDLSSGHATRVHYGQEHNLKKVCDELGFEFTEELFDGVYNYSEIIKLSEEYFKKVKFETGQIVEGVVIRSKYSNRLSTKFINNEYDANS